MGIGDAVAPDQGGPEDVQALVVGADEDIDGRSPSDGRAVETGIRQARKANEASMANPNTSQASSTTNMTGWAPCQVSAARQTR